MKKYFTKYGHGLFAFYYIVCMLLYFITSNREPIIIISETTIDKLIPFSEIFIIPYFIWYFYLLWAFVFFFFKSKKLFLNFCIFTFSGMTITYLTYFIIPNAIDFRPSIEDLDALGRSGILMDLVRFTYTIDKPHNVCPSLHCYNAIVISAALSKSRIYDHKKWIPLVSWILTVIICLSTVFVKQHSVVDIVFAIVFAAVMYLFTYKINWKFVKD